MLPRNSNCPFYNRHQFHQAVGSRDWWLVWSLLAFFLLLPVSAFSTSFVFSGDLRGEIKPCGCAEEGDMGGLLRRATVLREQRATNPELLYLDLGNNFSEPSEQGNLKVRLIHTALRQFQPAAILVGPNEWAYGLNTLAPELPYLLSNQSENLSFLPLKRVGQKGRRSEIRGFLSPSLVYQNENDPPLVKNAEAVISEWKPSLAKTKPDLAILLFRGTDAELEAFQHSGLFDLIVSGSTNDDELKQVMARRTELGEIPLIPTKGQGLVSGTWDWQAQRMRSSGEVAIPAGLSVDWLRRNVADDPELLPAFQAYDAEVKELFFTNLDRMEQQQQESPFVGAAVCQGCHAEAFAIWKDSRHGHAFATLEAKGKHFDPECLECHVVGLKPWEPPPNLISPALKSFVGRTGFLSPQLTPQLMNVQCENCHGPARTHLANPVAEKPPQPARQACTTCHVGSHSPLFKFETYWPKIRHR